MSWLGRQKTIDALAAAQNRGFLKREAFFRSIDAPVGPKHRKFIAAQHMVWVWGNGWTG